MTGRDRLWPLLVVGLLGCFALLTVWAVREAVVKTSPVSDPSYYRRGVTHDQEIKARGRAAELGWTLDVATDGDQLRVRLRDGAGKPVVGARLELVLPPAGDPPLLLAETEPGAYTAPLPPSGHVRTARLAVSHADGRIDQDLLHPARP
jgi:nitrogen fixation protein FixH